MSMGYAGAYADVIDESTVKKFCPNEFAELVTALGEDIDDKWADLARVSMYNELEVNEISQKLGKLQDAFQKKAGLSLGLAYHDSDDEGDTYDEVSGTYWWVGGMYELTPAGKKMEKYVSRMNFVQFG